MLETFIDFGAYKTRLGVLIQIQILIILRKKKQIQNKLRKYKFSNFRKKLKNLFI